MRIPPSLALLTLAGLVLDVAGCERGDVDQTQSTPPDDVAELCADLTNTFECARRIESTRLPQAQSVHRSGDSLVLAMSDGAPLALVDSVDDQGVGVRYSFQGRHPRLPWYLVHVQEYEGDGFLLVNSVTGTEYPLDARPLYAPGGGRFATANFDLEAGYTPNALRILGIDADSVWIVWETEPDDWGPVDAHWTSSTALRFTKRHPRDGGEHADSAAVLTFTGEGWQIDVP